MASLVLSQVSTTMLAPSLYNTIANGASIAASSALWSAAQGITGALGTIAGSVLDRMLFSQSNDYYGPRLNDLTVQTSTEGASLPIVYGTMRIAGNVIWSTGLEETATTTEAGGGSGGGDSYTTYSYKTDAAVAVCEGTITGIRRIWADTKLIYDVGDAASAETLVASTQNNIRFYNGSETQLCDPLIQAITGTDLAYRGTAYVVFEDLELANYGNRLPNFSFEVVKSGTFNNTLFSTSYTKTSSTSHYPSIYKVEGTTAYLAMSNTEVISGDWFHANIYKINILDPLLPFILVGSSTLSGSWCAGSGISHRTDLMFGQTGANTAGTSNPLYYPNTGYPAFDYVYVKYYALDRDGYYYGENALTYKLERRNIGTDMPISLIYIPPFTLWTITSSLFWGCGASKTYVYFGVYRDSDHASVILKYNKKSGVFISSYFDTGIAAFTVQEDDEIIYTIGTNIYSSSDFFITRKLLRVVTSDYISVGKGNYNWVAIRIDSNSVLVGTDIGPYYNICILYPQTIPLGTQTVKEVVEDLVNKADIPSTKYDFSNLSTEVLRGYTITHQMKASEALTPITATYKFDVSEEDGKLKSKMYNTAISQKTFGIQDIGGNSI